MAQLVEGEDYYMEDGLLVMTEAYLRKRGYCCENGCRHCPYGFRQRQQQRSTPGEPSGSPPR